MTTKTEYAQVIRKHCLNCCSGSYLEVENCTSGPDAAPYATCALWPFRLGTDPNPNPNKVEAGKLKYEKGLKAYHERQSQDID